jgi:hypothetical protein
MKKLLFILLMISSPLLANVQTEKFVWVDAEGNGHVTYYAGGSDDILNIINDLGFNGGKVAQVKDNDPILKEDSKFIKFVGNKPVIDKEKQKESESKDVA